jgi:hypothetical protein
MAMVGSVVLLVGSQLLYDASMSEQPLDELLAVGMMPFFAMFVLSGAGSPPTVMCWTMAAVSTVLPLTSAVCAPRVWDGTRPACCCGQHRLC